jgi:hypothetical protein
VLDLIPRQDIKVLHDVFLVLKYYNKAKLRNLEVMFFENLKCAVPYTDGAVRGGLVVIVVAIRPKVRQFKPGRGRDISKGDKNT